ncbi:MAG: hypothetical protein N4A46_13045 [Schleiferiaceae bacterium]|nr:hypothetical protein [Schleiferiaceae bacterium]
MAMIVIDLFVSVTGIARTSEVYFNEDQGKSYRSDYEYVWFSEGYSMGRVNHGEYFGPYYTKEKQSGIKRVALLGDSYVEGLQVFERNHFRALIEKQLSIGYEDSVQVLNFGRSNFNFPNMYGYSKLKVEQYQPDLYIVFVSQEDLWSLETDALLPNVDPQSLAPVPYLGLQNLSSFKNANSILSYSTTAYMLNSSRRKVKEEGLINIVFEGKFATKETSVAKERKVAPLNLKLLDRIDNERFIIVYREKKPLPIHFKSEILKRGIKFIDLSEVLAKQEQIGKNPNYWFNLNNDGHWNRHGHKTVAQYLSPIIIQELSELED